MQGNDGQGISTVWIVANSLSREYDGPAARGRGAAYGSTVGAQALRKTRCMIMKQAHTRLVRSLTSLTDRP